MRHAASRPRLRALLPVVVMCGALLALGAGLTVMVTPARPPGPVYPLGIIWRYVEQSPTHWMGRTVRVRAVALPCIDRIAGPGPDSPCLDPLPMLLDPVPDGDDAAIPFAVPATPDALAWLRRLPLLGQLVPAPPSAVWGNAATYTIQLRPIPCAAGNPPAPPCYEAVLLDTAP